jgi:5-methylcytosine-specific restriction enzyme A
MDLLAYWRIDNYRRDLDEGAGYNFNSRQQRLHSAIDVGETLWLFTAVRNPPRLYLAAKLLIRAKTMNAPSFKYGPYRVWGDFAQSRYFKVRLDEPADEAFELLQGLRLSSGSFSETTRQSLPQHCQTMRALTPEANAALEAFSLHLVDEERAVQVADEYELEREIVLGSDKLSEIVARDHTGPSEQRRQHLLATAARDRQFVMDLHELYRGRCQLCAFDSPVVYNVASAEAHHIVYLSRGGEDALENMVLLCPNHHTVIHKADAHFDYATHLFAFPNGRVEPLCLNTHLARRGNGPGEKQSPAVVTDNKGLRTPKEIAALVVSHLSPDLLSAEWLGLRTAQSHPLSGYCYVASEAMYHLMGGATAGWKVFRCDLPGDGTHWWLTDPDGGVVDLTAEQFASPPDYALGRRTGFLSKTPSKRAAGLIERVRAALGGS